MPGLLDPVPYLDKLPHQELPELSIFSTILSRGRWSIPESLNDSDNCFYDCLYNQFALNKYVDSESSKWQSQSSQKQTAIAAVSLLHDREKYVSEQVQPLQDSELNGKWIMRIDPCFMTPDRDQLIMARTQNMAITMPEAQQLVDTINNFFSAFAEERFWKLYALSPDRWYIVSDKAINIHTVPPEKVLGQSLKAYLLSGEDSQHWLNLFNEMQMILHQSPINKQRLAEKKLPINSVWFWGAGRAVEFSSEIKEASSSALQPLIYTDNIFAKGLARIIRQQERDLPGEYQTVVGNHEREFIYIVEDLMQAVNNRDIFSWVGLLQQFEKRYLQSLLKEIQSGHIKQVEFISPSGTKLFLSRKLLRRWWRRKLPFHAFLTPG